MNRLNGGLPPLFKPSLIANTIRKHILTPHCRELILCLVGLNSTLAFANDTRLPQGGLVTLGHASISKNGASLQVNQSSLHTELTWDSFDIGYDAQVRFQQPGTDSIAVNRITGANGSEILGRLDANGQVFLVNPNGILFGRNAQVNVGGIVASTLELDSQTLNSNQRKFSGGGLHYKSVINNGSITAEGGYVALLGRKVANNGIIQANLGTVAIGATEAATLNFSGSQLVSLQIDKGTFDALAENSGLIQADGGHVYMNAAAANDLTSAVVNHSGVIQARSLVERDGRIILLGDMEHGTTNVSGSLDASAVGETDGGFIETSAATVNITDAIQVTTHSDLGQTGEWLVDPTDYSIAAAGGDITGATLSANLGTTNVTLQSDDGGSGTDGDIFVNDSITWASGNTLTLTAFRNVEVNQTITATGAGNLVLRAGNAANGIGTVNFNGAGAIDLNTGRGDIYYNVANYATPTSYAANFGAGDTFAAWMLINDVNDLQNINDNLTTTGIYALADDIDASATSTWNGGLGFLPIADNATFGSTFFEGQFDGQSHNISNLVVNRPAADYQGLFALTQTGAIIRNVNLLNGSITGDDYTGALAGLGGGTISGVTASMTINGDRFTGGLVGRSVADISNSSATGNVTGGLNAVSSDVGGLVGTQAFGSVSNSFATGNVTSSGSNVGGFIGNSTGTVTDSYATGVVSGIDQVGGLIGITTSTVTDSYATGNVSGEDWLGGLIGESSNNVTNSYATGTVTSSVVGAIIGAGGLVGRQTAGTIATSFASGNITGDNRVGGLVGSNEGGTITQSFATGDVNANDSGAGGLIGRNLSGTLNEVYSTGTVSGAVFLGGLIGYADAGTFTDAFFDTTTSGQVVGANNLSTGITGYTTAQMMDGTNYATWGLGTAWRIYDGNTRPLLGSFLTDVTVTADDINRTYDGAGYGGGFGYSTSEGAITLQGTAVYSTSGVNAGTYAISISDLYSDTPLGYDITFANGTQTISPKALSISGSSAANRAFNGTTSANVSPGGLTGFIGSETVVVSSATGVFANNNVGSGINVTATYTLGDGTNGGLASNYSLTNETLTADITAASLTVSTSDVTRAYDGTAAAAGAAIVTAGTLYGTDTLFGGTFSFDDGNVGTDKSVSTTDVTVADGNGGNNYTITYANNTNSSITAAGITVSTSDVSRTYDGTTAAAGTAIVTAGTLYGTDTLNGGTFSFDDKNTGTGKSVSTASVTVSDGNEGGNYTITYAENTNSSITAAEITVSASDVSRAYDGTTAAASTAIVTTGTLYGTDALTGGTFSFDDANAGTGKSVSTTGITVTDGNDGNNYTTTFTNNTNSSITPLDLTVKANSGSQTYDGIAFSGNFDVTYAGFIAGDNETNALSGELQYQGSSQGAVNTGTYDIIARGLSATNYVIAYDSGQLIINPAQLTYVADQTTAYAGQVSALTGSVTGLVGTDTLTDTTSGTLRFSSNGTTSVTPGLYDVHGEGLSVTSGNYLATIIQDSSNSNALEILAGVESPVETALGDVEQTLRREEDANDTELSTEELVNDNKKDIVNITIHNEGIRLPEGLEPLK